MFLILQRGDHNYNSYFQISSISAQAGAHVRELQESVDTYLARCQDNYNMSTICEVIQSISVSLVLTDVSLSRT